MTALQQILVPVDYSETSEEALRMAGNLARAFDGRLLVLHLLRFDVYGMSELPMVVPGQTDIGDALQLDEERAHLTSYVRRVLGSEAPAFEVEVEWGSPYHEIVEYAIDRHVDLIVMGTHGRTGIKHALLGSVAEKTVRLAPCPVMTVRPSVEAHVPAHAAHEGAVTAGRHYNGQVGRLMSRAPITIGADDMLAEARGRMVHAGVRHLPVVDRGELVGILSDRDLRDHMGQLERTRVHVAMTANPTTVTPDVTADTAARVMLDHGVRALPVVEGKRVIGVLSASDIMEDYVRAARG